MLVDLDGFKVTQSSAKPGGAEFGLRVHDSHNIEAMMFLFLTPATLHQNASSCLQGELQEVRKRMAANFIDVKLNPESKDTGNYATMLVTGKNGQYLYGFYGHEDQCLSIEIYSDPSRALELKTASAFLGRQNYDPNYKPTAKDKFIYATVLYNTHLYGASVPVYADYLQSLPHDESTKTQRRIATDNMGMAAGISGDVDRARKIFENAIKQDPDYPLNYYNLACADAEQGNAKDAKLHLQQAFDRKDKTNPGEQLPEPAQDDSIQKLQKNKEFWAFVQTLK